MAELTARQNAVADITADVIVAWAREQAGGDPEAFVDYAVAAMANLVAEVPDHPAVTHNESRTLTPRELEQRIASPGARFDRR